MNNTGKQLLLSEKIFFRIIFTGKGVICQIILSIHLSVPLSQIMIILTIDYRLWPRVTSR